MTKKLSLSLSNQLIDGKVRIRWNKQNYCLKLFEILRQTKGFAYKCKHTDNMG